MAERHRRKESTLANIPDFIWLQGGLRRYTLFTIVLALVAYAIWQWTPGFVPAKHLTLLRIGVIAVAAVLGAFRMAGWRGRRR